MFNQQSETKIEPHLMKKFFVFFPNIRLLQGFIVLC